MQKLMKKQWKGLILPWAGADPVAALHPRHLHPASWPMGSPLGKSHGENFPSGIQCLVFFTVETPGFKILLKNEVRKFHGVTCLEVFKGFC